MKIRFLKLCSAFLLLLAGCASGKISGFVYSFKNYEIKNIGFVKTADTSGYIYIELLIMPYGFMEYIDVVMEV